MAPDSLKGGDTKKKHTFILIITIITLMLPSCAPASARPEIEPILNQDPLLVVDRVTTGFNAGDVEGVLAYYAPDIRIIFITGSVDPWDGMDLAWDFLEYHAYMDSEMTVEDCEYDGESRVKCSMTLNSTWIEAAGLPPYVFPELRYEFNEQGQVREIFTRVDATTSSLLDIVVRSYVAWMNNNYPQEADIITDPKHDFNFEYNLEAAEIQDVRIREWKEQTDS